METGITELEFKRVTSRCVDLEKCSLNFSSSSFTICLIQYLPLISCVYPGQVGRGAASVPHLAQPRGAKTIMASTVELRLPLPHVGGVLTAGTH